ncbi:MAG: AMIN-like domain-containing (lipo)protein [Nocardioides sp.]
MRVFLSMAIALACLTACGSEGGGEPTSAPATSETTISQEPSSDASTTDDPTSDTPGGPPTDGVPPFPENTARETAEPSGEGGLAFTDVRVGEHEGFDRIVLEFTGTGIPGWQVTYVDEAVLDGSGEVVTLGGNALLDIYASGTTWPAAGYYSGPRQFEPENGGEVSDVHVGGTFEGYTQVLVGIDGGALPFRVFALTDPSRLVVDVVDGSAD